MKIDDFIKDEKDKKPWEVEDIEWKEVKLKKITLPIKKINPSKKNPESEFLYLDIAGIDNTKFKVASYKRIKWKNAPSRARKEIREGDVVFATTRPYLKNIAIVPKELDNQVCSTGFCVLRPNPEYTISKWIFFNVIRKPFVEHISSKMRGTSYPAVLDNDLYYSKIPLSFRNGKPDLETQKKIVEYIEANFSRIDKILEKKKREIKWLDELWEGVLEQVFKPKDGEEWREVRLGNLVIEKPRYGLTAKAKDKGKTVFLRITDINDQGEIKNNSFKFVDIDEPEKAKYDIRKGDLLLARSGSVGNFFVAFKYYPDWIYASYLIRFRLDLNKVHLMFVKYFLSSQYFKKWVSYQKRPGAQPNINAKEYSSFKIPLPFRNNQPDLEKQKEIANYLDSVYEKIKALKEKIQNQITQLEEMKESILDEVFNHGDK